MKKELVYATEDITDEVGKNFVLKYFLIEEHVGTSDGFGFYSYGIEIIKESPAGSDRHEVTELILRMAKGVVTPSAFYDVLCDEIFRKSLDMCKRICS